MTKVISFNHLQLLIATAFVIVAVGARSQQLQSANWCQGQCSSSFVCADTPTSGCFSTQQACTQSGCPEAKCVAGSAYVDSCPFPPAEQSCMKCHSCISTCPTAVGFTTNYCSKSAVTGQPQCFGKTQSSNSWDTCTAQCHFACINQSTVTKFGTPCDAKTCPGPHNGGSVPTPAGCDSCLSLQNMCQMPLYFCFVGTRLGQKEVANLCFASKSQCEEQCDYMCVSKATVLPPSISGDACTSACPAFTKERCATTSACQSCVGKSKHDSGKWQCAYTAGGKPSTCSSCLQQATECGVNEMAFCFRGRNLKTNLCFANKTMCTQECAAECVSYSSPLPTAGGSSGGDVCTDFCPALPSNMCDTSACQWCGGGSVGKGRELCTFMYGGSREVVCSSCAVMPLAKCPSPKCTACNSSSGACIPSSFTQAVDKTLNRQSSAFPARRDTMCPLSTSSFQYCSAFSEQVLCQWPPSYSLLQCHWCDAAGKDPARCLNAGTPCNASCVELSRGECAGSCKWCEKLGFCLPLNHSCNCLELSPSASLCRKANNSCVLLPPPLAIVDHSHYCDSKSLEQCPPLTCTQIKDSLRCTAAGCQYNSKTRQCDAGPCRTFFLPSFESYPYGLLVLGIVKDLLILLLVGTLGEIVMRRVDKVIVRLKRFLFCPSCCSCSCCITTDAPISVTEKTVYICDVPCRPDPGFNRFGFDEYVAAVADHLFDLPAGSATPDNLARLHDAVAHALVSTKTWIYLPKWSSPAQDSPSGQKQLIRKQQITAEDLDSNLPSLQGTITKHVHSCQDTVIFFAMSRSRRLAAANSLTNFPSEITLMLYILTLGVMIATTFFDVVGVSANRAEVEAIAAGCKNMDSNSSSTANVTTTNSSSTSEGSGIVRPALMLIGHRFVNSSALGTSLLVLVKTCRALGIYFLLGKKSYRRLPLSARLPMHSFLSSRVAQLAVFTYFVVVAPFLLAPLTYGAAAVSGLCAVPIIAAAGATALLAGAVALVTKVAESRGTYGDTADGGEDDGQSLTSNGGGNGLRYDAVSSPGPPSAFHLQKSAGGGAPAPVSAATPAATDGDNWWVLLKSLCEFLVKEELIIVFFTIAVGTAFNVMCLLAYSETFAVESGSAAFGVDYDSRSVHCVYEGYVRRASSVIALMSSYVPFM